MPVIILGVLFLVLILAGIGGAHRPAPQPEARR